MRILSENTLAVAIDYQSKIVPAMHGIDELIHNSSILLKGLGVLEIPILVMRQYPKGLGDTIPEIATLTENCPVYDKIAFSCWDSEDFREAVKASGRDTILICGIEAHVCVLQTAIDLIATGYHVVLVEDCITSRKPSDKISALKRAEKEGAIITTCESILFELTRVSGTPTFKEISRLVK